MYTTFFSLDENPFSIAPNPRYLYQSSQHMDALAHLLHGTAPDGCITLLTGDVGTGKTTISRCFIEQISRSATVAVIINPTASGGELLRLVCKEFGISCHPDQNIALADLVNLINRYLLDIYRQGGQALLLIDEAQNLDMESLEMLRLLTNLETDTHKLLKIILIAQPELKNNLRNDQFRQINQRITSRFHLTPFSAKDVACYIEHRLHIAGGKNLRLFNQAAVKEIHRISGGIPRLINLLCNRCLIGAYAHGITTINRTMVKRAAQEIFDESTTTHSWLTRSALIFLSLGLGGLIFFLVWYLLSAQPTGLQELSPWQ